MKVFWSWQSDTPGKTGRHFVRDVLTEAIEELKQTPEIEESVRSEIHLDQDRKGVPGSPDLARVILKKITQAVVFVADVTPVGNVTIAEGDTTRKKLINSNVAIELGYALHALGDGALLMVMNEFYGARSDLPFDLQSKAGPIMFSLPPEASKKDTELAAKRLRGHLKEALALCVDKRVQEVRQQATFQAAEPKNGPARFRRPGESIGIRWDEAFPFGSGSVQEIFLANGPAVWLRLMPKASSKRVFAPQELRHKALNTGNVALMPLLEQAAHTIRAGDGFGVCHLYAPDSTDTDSVVFAFETGEVWSIDTALLAHSDNRIPFLEKRFVGRLRAYETFLLALGLGPPYRWICGLAGAKNYRLEIPGGFGPGPRFLSDEIIVEGEYKGDVPGDVLNPFFEALFAKCGVPRPSNLPR